MNVKPFQVPAYFTGAKTMAGGIRCTIDTQETLSPEDIARLFSMKDRLGWFLFAAQELTVDNLATLPEIQDDTKSPSQRLRDRMYVYHKTVYSGNMSFREWYADALDKIGQRYLDKVEDERD